MSSRNRWLLIFLFFLILLKNLSFEKERNWVRGLDFVPPFYFEEQNSFLIKELAFLPTSNQVDGENPFLKEGEYFYGIVTGYSSSPRETDESPYLTASGKKTHFGICANNLLPFGTKVKFPEIFGEQIFVVEDRMAFSKSPFHFDIWFEDQKEALIFGATTTKIEILSE